MCLPCRCTQLQVLRCQQVLSVKAAARFYLPFLWEPALSYLYDLYQEGLLRDGQGCCHDLGTSKMHMNFPSTRKGAKFDSC
jgi:hypothetical protein